MTEMNAYATHLYQNTAPDYIESLDEDPREHFARKGQAVADQAASLMPSYIREYVQPDNETNCDRWRFLYESWLQAELVALSTHWPEPIRSDLAAQGPETLPHRQLPEDWPDMDAAALDEWVTPHAGICEAYDKLVAAIRWVSARETDFSHLEPQEWTLMNAEQRETWLNRNYTPDDPPYLAFMEDIERQRAYEDEQAEEQQWRDSLREEEEDRQRIKEELTDYQAVTKALAQRDAWRGDYPGQSLHGARLYQMHKIALLDSPLLEGDVAETYDRIGGHIVTMLHSEEGQPDTPLSEDVPPLQQWRERIEARRRAETRAVCMYGLTPAQADQAHEHIPASITGPLPENWETMNAEQAATWALAYLPLNSGYTDLRDEILDLASSNNSHATA